MPNTREDLEGLKESILVILRKKAPLPSLESQKLQAKIIRFYSPHITNLRRNLRMDDPGGLFRTECVVNGHAEIVPVLHELGLDFDTCDPSGYRRYSALASFSNQPHVITALHLIGVDLLSCDLYGDTPGTIAAEKGYDDCLTALSVKEENLTAPNSAGKTPLQKACNEQTHAFIVSLIKQPVPGPETAALSL